MESDDIKVPIELKKRILNKAFERKILHSEMHSLFAQFGTLMLKDKAVQRSIWEAIDKEFPELGVLNETKSITGI